MTLHFPVAPFLAMRHATPVLIFPTTGPYTWNMLGSNDVVWPSGCVTSSVDKTDDQYVPENYMYSLMFVRCPFVFVSVMMIVVLGPKKVLFPVPDFPKIPNLEPGVAINLNVAMSEFASGLYVKIGILCHDDASMLCSKYTPPEYLLTITTVTSYGSGCSLANILNGFRQVYPDKYVLLRLLTGLLPPYYTLS